MLRHTQGPVVIFNFRKYKSTQKHVRFLFSEFRLVVLGQTSAACTVLGLPEMQDGISVAAKYTRQAAGKKAISLSLSLPPVL